MLTKNFVYEFPISGHKVQATFLDLTQDDTCVFKLHSVPVELTVKGFASGTEYRVDLLAFLDLDFEEIGASAKVGLASDSEIAANAAEFKTATVQNEVQDIEHHTENAAQEVVQQTAPTVQVVPAPTLSTDEQALNAVLSRMTQTSVVITANIKLPSYEDVQSAIRLMNLEIDAESYYNQLAQKAILSNEDALSSVEVDRLRTNL